MPQFVILTHDWPDLHWDLMLESNGILKTWRLLSQPTAECVIEAVPIADHRIHYLNYEGPVSMNRGSVHRFEHGDYSEQPQALNAEPMIFSGNLQLNGKTFKWNAEFIENGEKTMIKLTQQALK
ncbi:DNA polymerase ligase N-terminal domain-containing protein [Planctomicrobium sp. SH527]|uniref:DNA polymerase ligase N-terminal domain-containing protein n=1 Tax=Planctomicrobium sp. SH527 TaxID=3448123 RepID=UPI003F5B261B